MAEKKRQIHADHRERMRRRVINYGAESLAPHEVMETLLYTPVARRNTNDIGHMLIDRFGTAANVFSASKEELTDIPGVGPASADFLKDIGRVVEACAISRMRIRPEVMNPKAARLIAERYFEAEPNSGCAFLAIDAVFRLMGTLPLPSEPTSQDILEAAVRLRAGRAIIIFRSKNEDVLHKEPETESYSRLRKLLSYLKIELADVVYFENGRSWTYQEIGGLESYAAKSALEDEARRHYENNMKPKRYVRSPLFGSSAPKEVKSVEQDPERIVELINHEMGKLLDTGTEEEN